MILCFARKFPCQCQPELSCEVKEVSAQNTFICGIRQDRECGNFGDAL